MFIPVLHRARTTFLNPLLLKNNVIAGFSHRLGEWINKFKGIFQYFPLFVVFSISLTARKIIRFSSLAKGINWILFKLNFISEPFNAPLSAGASNPSNGLRCGRGDEIINRWQRPASLATLPTSPFDQRRRRGSLSPPMMLYTHSSSRFSMVWNNFWKPAARIALELQQYRGIEQRIVAALSLALLPLARMPPARHSFRSSCYTI